MRGASVYDSTRREQKWANESLRGRDCQSAHSTPDPQAADRRPGGFRVPLSPSRPRPARSAWSSGCGKAEVWLVFVGFLLFLARSTIISPECHRKLNITHRNVTRCLQSFCQNTELEHLKQVDPPGAHALGRAGFPAEMSLTG